MILWKFVRNLFRTTKVHIMDEASYKLALELQLEDARAASDRAYALHLYQEELASLHEDTLDVEYEYDEEIYALITHQQAPPDPSPAGGTSGQHQARAANPPEPAAETRSCQICVEDIPRGRAIQCTGGHDYCRECMLELFRRAVAAAGSFPARCCEEALPVEMIAPFAPADLVRQYRAKEVESNTADRTYCFKETCSTFIPPTAIQNNQATCPTCRRQTCRACKGRFHEGPCARATHAAVLEMADRQGWKRCYRCRELVEQAGGCNHMSKRCILSTHQLN